MTNDNLSHLNSVLGRRRPLWQLLCNKAVKKFRRLWYAHKLVRRKKLIKYAKGYVWEIGPEEKIFYAAPIVFGGNTPRILLRLIKQLFIEPAFVCEIADVELAGTWAIGILKSGEIIKETFQSYVNMDQALLDLRYARRFPIDMQIEVACSLVMGHHNYYHWILEGLTLLCGYELYFKKTGVKPFLIVDKDLEPFQKDSLKLLGYREHDYILWDMKRVQVKRLVIPSNRRSSERNGTPYDCLSPKACHWLRKRVLANFAETIDKHSNFERIYVSRCKAGLRKIVNEPETVSLLQSFGFKSYCLEDMTFNEQVTLFSKANFVIGPHGAGLTNIIWAQEGACIVELAPENLIKCDFFHLARALGFKYLILICKVLKKEKSDMLINIPELEKLLHNVICSENIR
jgi:hypothetical protein